ncbi:hypothetical protein MHK_002497 [Candidatus Magnetomorum sp. HK-1]|nr:hypothetical protein MHK_002497 [Candidatus Magnetomorum sp. HK-1]
MKTKFYYLNIISDPCNLNLTLNGFPLEKSVITYHYNNLFILNEYLVGKNNNLTIEIKFDPNDNLASINTFRLSGTLKLFFEGEVVTPEDGKIIPLKRLSSKEKIETQSIGFGEENINKEEKKIIIKYNFDNEDYNYSHLFWGNSVDIDNDQLIKYAEKIIKLFNSKDAVGFYAEYRNKVSDMAASRGKALKDIEPFLMEQIETAMKQGLSIIPKNISVTSWCNSRIFELHIPPDESLIITEEDKDGMNFELPIFVTLINGKIKIIR